MYKQLSGYITSISGESPEAEASLHFDLFCPSESKGEPENSQQEAEEGFHHFTIHKLTDNRELVWVSLLRDAMVHKLLARVSYVYTDRIDPGTGEVTKIEVTSFPFKAGSMHTIKGKVLLISIDEYFAWKGKYDFLSSDTIDAALIILEDSQEKFVLPLRETNKRTKHSQLNLLQRAWENQWPVVITYHKSRFTESYSNVVTGVSICTRY